MEPERYSEELRLLLQQAAAAMRTRQHAYVDVEHLLLAMVQQPAGAAARIFERLRAPFDAITADLDQELSQLPTGSATTADQLYVSPRVQRVLARAREQADQLGDVFVGVELVLLAIGGEAGGGAAQVLEHHGISQDQLAIELVDLRHPIVAEVELPSVPAAAAPQARTLEERIAALEAAVALLRGEEPPAPSEAELLGQLQQARLRIAELERQHRYLQDLLVITQDNLTYTRELLANELAARRGED